MERIALVTGGTSGIGLACAQTLCSSYDRVYISGRDVEKGNKVIDQLKNNKIIFCKMDVNSDQDIIDVVTMIEKEYAGLDCLVNCAGIYPKFDSLDKVSRSSWNEVMETNVTSIMSVTKMFLPLLIKKSGNIVNIASVAGLQHFASGQGYAYAASKSSVIQFTRMIAKIYSKSVRINCICPGVIDTPLYFNLDRERMGERIPIGRVGEPQEIANVVNFLASPEASYLQGAIITVDGGLTL